MKVGFSKNGLTFNSKKFNPLNVPLTKKLSIDSDIPVEPVNASEILSVFEKPNIRKANRAQGVEVLKTMLDKAR